MNRGIVGILFVSIALSGSTPNEVLEAESTWITVFIHGMMSIKHHLSFENICRFLKDDVEKTECGDPTIYAATVELMRRDSFFYQNQAMQGPGLQPVRRGVYPGNAAGALAFCYDEMYSCLGKKEKNYYYTFGWFGILSARTRLNEAAILGRQLKDVYDEFQKKGIKPKIRLIGYSHGGNVALNLARNAKDHPYASRLSIDELILIGTPIQAETEEYIYSPLFKHIYNLYSEKDRVQIADLFSSGRFLSGHIFTPRLYKKLPANLTQVQLRVTRVLEKGLLKTSHCLNFSKDRTVWGKSGLFRDMSPGHSELWFFGWTPLNYRKHFPLYPFPLVAFVPLIINECMHVRHNEKTDFLVCDFRPQHNFMILRRPHSKMILSRPALWCDKEKFVEQLSLFSPLEGYTEKVYRDHIYHAYKKSAIWLTECLSRKKKFKKEQLQGKNAQKTPFCKALRASFLHVPRD